MTLEQGFFEKILLTVSWILFFCLFFAYIYPVGHLSDDVVILNRALKGEPLWTIHYSLTLPYLWTHLSAGGFKILALLIHLANCGLFYRFLTQFFGFSQKHAIFGATFFLFSAAGFETLIWNCCLGYLMTAFFLFLALNLITLFERITLYRTSFLMGVIQFLAVATWDWGILLTPICFIAVLSKHNLKTSLTLIIPAALVLIAYLAFRSTLGLDAIYENNGMAAMAKYFFGSPLLMLLPNVNKELFSSFSGIVLSATLLIGILYLTFKMQGGPAVLIFLGLTLLPWIIGGHPSSRYYYMSAPFLFIFILFFQKQLSMTNQFVLMVFLMFQVLFFMERAELWFLADRETVKIGHLIKKAYEERTEGIPFVVVNIPDAFGPAHLAMRPQSWHSGIEILCDEILQVKTRDAAFVWKDQPTMTRKEIKETFHNANIFEVIVTDQIPHGTYELVSFSNF